MKKLENIAFVAVLLMFMGKSCLFAQGVTDGFIHPEIKQVSFKADTFKITDFGALANTLEDCSEAINEAIHTCSKSGGGTVLIPAGLWHSGPVVMQNNVNLHIVKNATVVFSRNFDDYPIVKSSFEGWATYRCQSPISGKNLTNIAFTGKGIFDGSGEIWRPVKKEKMTAGEWSSLINSGGILDKQGRIWYPSEAALKGSELHFSGSAPKEEFLKIKDYLRPVMVSLIECNKVLMDGPTFQNSPAWCVHPLLCENITVKNVNVRNPWYAQNGDGIDLESCRNGIITDCTFDVGDDAICIKSGKDEEGRKRGVPCENIIVQNCVVYHGHGGFTIGSEMSGGVKNFLVQNCTFLGTDIGLRFKSNRGRGGVVENIFISNITMTEIPAGAISFNLFYGGASPLPDDNEILANDREKNKKAPVKADETTPSFKNIFMENIYCDGAGQAVIIEGLPEMFVDNLVLKNARIKAKKGISLLYAENMKFIDCSFETSDKTGLQQSRVKEISYINTTIDGKKVK